MKRSLSIFFVILGILFFSVSSAKAISPYIDGGGRARLISGVSGTGADDAVITDASGKVIGHDQDLNRYKSYNVSWNWSIPDREQIKSGDNVNFILPSNVQVNSDITFNVTQGPGGPVIGTFTIKAGSNKGTLTFNDYLEQHPESNRHGTITITANGKIDSDQTTTDWYLNKVGWVNSNGQPTWNVVVNPQEKHYDSITITDKMADGQEIIPDSIVIQYGHYNQNGEFIVESEDTNPDNYTIDGNEIKFNFKDIDQAVQIVYNVKAEHSGILHNAVDATLTEDGKESHYTNSAEISYSGNGSMDGASSSSSSLSSSSMSSSQIDSSVQSSSSNVLSSSSSSINGISSNVLPSVSSSKALSSSEKSSSVKSSSSKVSSSSEKSSSVKSSSSKVSSSSEKSSLVKSSSSSSEKSSSVKSSSSKVSSSSVKSSSSKASSSSEKSSSSKALSSSEKSSSVKSSSSKASSSSVKSSSSKASSSSEKSSSSKASSSSVKSSSSKALSSSEKSSSVKSSSSSNDNKPASSSSSITNVTSTKQAVVVGENHGSNSGKGTGHGQDKGEGQSMPQTGETTAAVLVGLGLILLITASGIVINKKKN